MSECNIQLAVAGVNFRHTPLEIRNKFALTTDRIKSIYNADNDCLRDMFILSTCNRTEIYSSNHMAIMEQLYQYLQSFTGRGDFGECICKNRRRSH